MEITNNTIVNVCSYMPVVIVASTSAEDYIFEPCMTDNPIIVPISASEIKEIHSKSKIFADGWLTFENDVKDAMYKFLKIKNGDEILNQIEIMHCIVDGGKEDIAKLINIKSKGYFERVYGVYAALKQSNMYDISMRVAKAIEYRYKELQQGIINTKIELTDNLTNKDDKDKIIAEKDKAIQESTEKINALEKKLEELIAAISNKQVDNSETKGNVDTAPKTKRGRPPVNK